MGVGHLVRSEAEWWPCRLTPCARHGRGRGPHDTDASASGARYRIDRSGWARRSRPTRGRRRAGPRSHASHRGGGDASERRSRHRRPHGARITRRRTARCGCRLPRLDRSTGDSSSSGRATRNPRSARGLPLVTAPDPAPVLPAAESDGGAPRRYRAAHRGRRTRFDDHPAWDVRVERVSVVGDRDPFRRGRPVALRGCRDSTRR